MQPTATHGADGDACGADARHACTHTAHCVGYVSELRGVLDGVRCAALSDADALGAMLTRCERC
eukprot:1013198-Rhodomonas_salina.1